MAKNETASVLISEGVDTEGEQGASTLNPEIFRHLQSANWSDIGKRLTLYAIRRAQFYGWVDSASQLLPGRDFTIDDIVQHVILKTINGDRNWDPSRGSLFTWLKYQVNSVMDAWINNEPGKYEIPFGDDEVDEEAGEQSDTIAIEDVRDETAVHPEEALVNQDAAQENSERVGLIFQAVSDDPELVELVEHIYQTGETRPRFAAQELGTTVEDINNRKKRFFRRMSQLQFPSG